MSFIAEYVGEVLGDMLNTLKEWTCWLLNSVTDQILDFLIWLIEQLPGNGLDSAMVQGWVDTVYIFNTLVPVKEFCGMFSAYLAFRLTWICFKLVVWIFPGIGGGM